MEATLSELGEEYAAAERAASDRAAKARGELLELEVKLGIEVHDEASLPVAPPVVGQKTGGRQGSPSELMSVAEDDEDDETSSPLLAALPSGGAPRRSILRSPSQGSEEKVKRGVVSKYPRVHSNQLQITFIQRFFSGASISKSSGGAPTGRARRSKG